MESLRERYGYLPRGLVIVNETVGEDAMLRLAAKLGGLRVRCARAWGADNEIAQLFGQEIAEAIRHALFAAGIDRWDVPMMGHSLTRARRARIFALRQEGKTANEIALLLGITQRTVFYRPDEPEADPRQIDLESLLKPTG